MFFTHKYQVFFCNLSRRNFLKIFTNSLLTRILDAFTTARLEQLQLNYEAWTCPDVTQTSSVNLVWSPWIIIIHFILLVESRYLSWTGSVHYSLYVPSLFQENIKVKIKALKQLVYFEKNLVVSSFELIEYEKVKRFLDFTKHISNLVECFMNTIYMTFKPVLNISEIQSQI